MEIDRDKVKGKVGLTQKVYLQKVLQKFDVGCETKSVSTPLAPHFKLSTNMSPKTVDEREYMSHVLYASAVGSLMYVMVCTSPDLSQVASMVARYMYDPGKGYWEVVRCILRYIKGTVDVGLVFKKDDHVKQQCTGYVDSDYAEDLDKRHSIPGNVFTLSQAPVRWRCILQAIVALSMRKVEYIVLTGCERRGLALRLDG